MAFMRLRKGKASDLALGHYSRPSMPTGIPTQALAISYKVSTSSPSKAAGGESLARRFIHRHEGFLPGTIVSGYPGTRVLIPGYQETEFGVLVESRVTRAAPSVLKQVWEF
eukprot:3123796-Rhodomonas_salina.2